ncbi:alkanesulfonate monooxygenase [Actinocorallia herbida]|uniref:Alkanesulfonate monooxygenase n=1 Tax=Actinocorallia herbida TaxID=58109 RepID=A0A3N1CVX1_9ACTN|nr:LLM class flavin-dependent oxidoreductase [Actinocorallia herbida]ROO85430.1 alkanesulfonate monooxygenase [Actinocorallia herbida]
MTVKTFWYLSAADGEYPWSPDGLYEFDPARYVGLAKAIDQGGFEGALVATWPNDPFVSASMAALHTTSMKFLVAVYARMIPARLLAEKALTFDAFSNGRLLINSVNGRDNILTKYGMETEHDERYELGRSYWEDFRRLYGEGADSNFPNTPLRMEPTATDGVPVWGAGDSEAGLANSGQVLDAYLTMMRHPDFLAEKFATARASAEAAGRELTDYGALAGVIVRPTEAEALDRLASLFERTGIERMTEVLDQAVRRRTHGAQDLKTFTARDPLRQKWVDTLLAGQLPHPRDLKIGDNLYAGITAWSPLDIFSTGSSAVYLVGTPDGLTGTVADLRARTGLTALILGGWPLTEEAAQVAEHLIPRFSALP